MKTCLVKDKTKENELERMEKLDYCLYKSIANDRNPNKSRSKEKEY